jgi:hypothetical protein
MHVPKISAAPCQPLRSGLYACAALVIFESSESLPRAPADPDTDARAATVAAHETSGRRVRETAGSTELRKGS